MRCAPASRSTCRANCSTRGSMSAAAPGRALRRRRAPGARVRALRGAARRARRDARRRDRERRLGAARSRAGGAAPMSATWRNRPERGSPGMKRLIIWLALHAGRPFCRVLLVPICAYFRLTAPAARRASREFLARALGRPATLTRRVPAPARVRDDAPRPRLPPARAAPRLRRGGDQCERLRGGDRRRAAAACCSARTSAASRCSAWWAASSGSSPSTW